MALKLVRLQERLAFLQNLLTSPGVEEKISHFDRNQLLEEAEMLYQEQDELKEASSGDAGGRI